MNARRPLNLLIVGYGRMGRAVEALARQRGHRLAGIVSPEGGTCTSLDDAPLDQADVAIEFTHATAAPRIVARLLEAGIATVSGSTGWDASLERAREISRTAGTAFLWAPNFSLGVQVMSRLVASASAAFGSLEEYAPWLHEAHHDGKRDAPSGTARRLAEILLDRTPRLESAGPAPETAVIPEAQLSVSWTRAGKIPGTHVVGWDGPYEELRIEHVVRDRAVFAEGALRAAEWLVGRKGPHELGAILAESGRDATEDGEGGRNG